VTNELFLRMHPSGSTVDSKRSNEGEFIAIRLEGFVTYGDPILLSEIVTIQFAVPPRISGPYEGRHVTFLLSRRPAKARSFPMSTIPWPPKPATVIRSSPACVTQSGSSTLLLHLRVGNISTYDPHLLAMVVLYIDAGQDRNSWSSKDDLVD
jgi:hypothetical protein